MPTICAHRKRLEPTSHRIDGAAWKSLVNPHRPPELPCASLHCYERWGFRIDDVVGAVAVHGVGGAWGTLAAGMFKADALFNLAQIQVQLIGIAVAFLWAFPTTLVAYLILDRIVGVRASSQDEQRGLDYSEHFEVGYPEFQRDALHQGKA